MLHALLEYGRTHGIAGEAGFTSKAIRWLVAFDRQGRFLNIMPATQTEGGRSRPRMLAKAPHLAFSGDTPMRQFLVDTAQYALLFEVTEPDAKLLRKHEYFLHLLRAGGEAEPMLARIAEALSDAATRQAICDELAKQTPKAKPADNITFAVVGDSGARIIAEEDGWHAWWRGHFPSLFKKKADKKRTDGTMRCFLSGELGSPALTHPKIKGLGDVGGRVETTLVGFNLDAFCSFGLKQSANAAITENAAQQYVASLNELIANRSHKLAGAKVVYWYLGDVHEDEGEDVLGAMLNPGVLGVAISEEMETDNAGKTFVFGGDKAREVQALDRVDKLLTSIRTGQREDLRQARYCALTLSGNTSRVVIRDWMEGSFESLVENVQAWFENLSIVSRDGQRIVDGHKFRAVLAAPARELGDVAGPLEAKLWRCAVLGDREPIPYELMAQTLNRVRIDVINGDPARHARLGLLKAYCNRNRRMPPMTTSLKETCNDPAYLCGRIMAILADIQHAALGDVGAGVVQRYYAAASATPGLVLGRLVRQAQTGHLPKIKGGLRHWFDQQLAEVWNKFEHQPPPVLKLEQQTLFALGYYQQKAKRNTMPETTANSASDDAD